MLAGRHSRVFLIETAFSGTGAPAAARRVIDPELQGTCEGEQLTGIGSRYDIPANRDFRVEPGGLPIEESLRTLMAYAEKQPGSG